MGSGNNHSISLILDGTNFKVVNIGSNYSLDDLIVHNPKDRNLGLLLSEMTYDENLPVPIGVFYKEDKPPYDTMMTDQINVAKEKMVDLQSIIKGPNAWYVK